ncbi:hypothetical protein DID88_002189 [Monilinia fructigena]|uniref:Alcohol dehydrogenase-like C-terminal domain-containing protein n=1 Tax=Monilinia fructigena TaxID=38457 RepID=A0A395IVG9_9HELO|nr:hypothetical protein DID88_002189 [Monilinia fructigena]
MSTHAAVVTALVGGPLQLLHVPTIAPREGEEFVTLPWFLLGKIPFGISPEQAVTLPNNFVTVFHAATTHLDLESPWAKPDEFVPRHKDACILIWGGSSSVGQYAIQSLTYYGYTNIVTTASKSHHSLLQELGAAHTLDYRDGDIVASILSASTEAAANSTRKEQRSPSIPFILDCIGSQKGSLAPLAQIAQKGARVAVLLPVIVRDAEVDIAPEYSMDVKASAPWIEGVEIRGVRTHFYLNNPLFKAKLQSEIMPTLLGKGIVKPNKIKIVEGKTLLERAQRHLMR